MRTITEASTNTLIEYPEVVTWMLDNNFIHLKNLDGYPIKVSVKVTNGGVDYYMNYESELDNLTFRLNPLLWSFGPSTFDIDVTITANGSTAAESLKTFFVYYGKTLQERYHGSATTITYADSNDLSALEMYNIWSDAASPATFVPFPNPFVYNAYDGINTINAAGKNMIKHSNALLNNTIGDIWDSVTSNSFFYNLIKVCPKANAIKLEYYDTDGCKRYAIGEVLKKTMKATRADYVRGGVVYDAQPRSKVTDYQGTIQVGFAEVDPKQYLEDIMLSPTIVESVTGALLTPNTLSLDRDGVTKDIIITFNID